MKRISKTIIVQASLLICVGGITFGSSGANHAVEPEILASETNITLVREASLTLVCNIKHRGESTVVWKHNGNVLFVGSIRIRKDDNMSWKKSLMVVGQNNHVTVEAHELTVDHVDVQYAGNYTCEVDWKQDLDPLKKFYTVRVLVPPMVKAVMSTIQAEEGESIVMECITQGEPEPRIYWIYENGPLPSSAMINGSSLSLRGVTRQNAGTYVCMGDNLTGMTAKDTIHLQVQFPPIVSVPNPVVVKGETRSAQLACRVLGVPTPEVTWYRQNTLLDRDTSTNSTHSVLIISEVGLRDLGNYTCFAVNSMGRAENNVQLSGRPGGVRIISLPEQLSSTRYNLSWTVNSFAPVTNTYIAKKMADIYKAEWKIFKFQHPTPNYFVNRDFQYNFPLSNLEPNTRYEVKVKCVNEYGESEYSQKHIFKTPIHDYILDFGSDSWKMRGEKWWLRSGAASYLQMMNQLFSFLILVLV